MKKLRVLVVEDNDESRELYVLVPTRAGFEVKEAVGGEEALLMLDQCDPDLPITDLRTPSMSGIDLIRRIRAAKRSGRTCRSSPSPHTAMNNSPTRRSKGRRECCASRSSPTGCCPPSSS